MQPKPRAETSRPLPPSLRFCIVLLLRFAVVWIVLLGLSGFLESLPRNLKSRHRGRPTGIEGEVSDDADDLLTGDPVLQRLLEMKRQFVDAVERDQAGDRDKAPVAGR